MSSVAVVIGVLRVNMIFLTIFSDTHKKIDSSIFEFGLV